MRNFGDQSMSVAAVKDAGDFGASTLGLGDAGEMRRIVELGADIRIGESAEGVITTEQGAEDLDFVASHVSVIAIIDGAPITIIEGKRDRDTGLCRQKRVSLS